MRESDPGFVAGAGAERKESEAEEQALGPAPEGEDWGCGCPRDTRGAGDGRQGGDEADKP